MKRGYKKLFIFELIILFIIFLNKILFKLTNEYSYIVFLFFLLFIFKLIFGFEKDRHRYTKNIIIEIIIGLLMFFILFYIFGLFIGFVKINNYYNIKGFINYLLPLALIIIFKEKLRYQVLNKAEGCKFLVFFSCFIFIIFDIVRGVYFYEINTKYDLILFLSLNLFPAISNNILCSYISLTTGFKPSIIYLLIIQLYKYLIPIVPDIDNYLTSLIEILLPIVICYRLYNLYDTVKDKELIRERERFKYAPLIITTFIIIILVYFVSGYFKYHAIAIASGSMNPKINKGDIVIVEKIDKDNKIKKLKKGMIIAYKYNGVTIVHRILKVVNLNGENIIYTKGDSNINEDKYIVKENMIEGKVNFIIRYLGWPVVWLNESF